MKITQLQNLINIPKEMRESLDEEEFSACWYGCAGLDFRLVKEVNRLEYVTNCRPRLFIYTDNGYANSIGWFNQLDYNIFHRFSHNDWANIEDRSLGCARIKEFYFWEAGLGKPKEARLIWINSQRGRNNEDDQFIILIDCTNQYFERISIERGLNYDIVCEAGGMSGSQRPLRLGDLGAKWSFGYVPEFIGDNFLYQYSDNEYKSLPQWTKIPFYSEHFLDTGWGCNEGSGAPLRRVISIDSNKFSSQALAVGEAIRLGCKLGNRVNVKLDHLTELDPMAAEILAKLKIDISLNGLPSIGVDIAKILGTHEGTLSLNGLTNITNEIAQELASHKGSLRLDGVLTLSAESAKILSAIEGDIYLSNLQQLSSGAAEGLSAHQHTLHLDSINNIDEDTAKALAHHAGAIYLPSITSLNDHIAQNLACRRDVSFGEFRDISPLAVENLAKRNAYLNLKKLSNLVQEVAEALAKNVGTLNLDGVETLSIESAQALSKHTGTLELNGLKEINLCVASHLSNHNGLLLLNGLDFLSDEVSKKFFGPFGGWLWRNLTYNAWPWDKLGAECSCLLIKSYSPVINLNGQILCKRIAEVISEPNTRSPKIFIKSCSGISRDAVDALAKYEGELIFDAASLIDSPELISILVDLPVNIRLYDFKWGHIDSAKAKLLFKVTPIRGVCLYHPHRVDLNNAASITLDALGIIAKHPGGVHDHQAIMLLCSGLNPYLDNLETAEIIASFPRRANNLQRMMLGKISSLSVDCARILSKTKAPLYLDSLENISPEILEILSLHRGRLSLSGMDNIGQDEAGILAKHRGHLLLNKIQNIDLKALETLSSHVGMISLNQISSISDSQAEIISNIPSPISLKAVTDISDNGIVLLARKCGYKVRLNPTLAKKVVCKRATIIQGSFL